MRVLLALVGLTSLWVLAACGDQPSSGGSSLTADTLAPSDPTLAPTPTLAPEVAGTVVVPRPPTPVVLPSPTPLGGASVAETAAESASPAPDVSLESAALPISATVPPDATGNQLLEIGERLLAEGDFSSAAGVYREAADRASELSAERLAEARYGLGLALLQDGQPALAAEALDPLAASDDGTAPPEIAAAAAFQRGRTQLETGQPAAAIDSFTAYLEANPDMAAYVQPLIAEALQQLGDTAGAIAAYEAALAAPSHRLSTIALHRRLAELYLAQGSFADAVGQYDAIHDLAQTEFTKGEMTYLAGQAELQAGNTEAAYARYLKGMTDYPRAVQSYWGLIELVEAGIPVDEFQRGLVDFYAAAYQPGIDAFLRYIESAPEDYRKDTHLYLAWSYEALGNLEAALAELDAYSEFDPAAALIERADMLARAGDIPNATAAYETFLEEYPDNDKAPQAAWSAASLAENAQDSSAVDRYLYLAENYPAHEDAPEAISRAAWLAGLAGNETRSVELWQRLADQYPQSIYGSEALVWLMRLAEEGAADLDLDALREKARALEPAHYFAIRARDVAEGIAPFVAESPLQLPEDETADRQEAEAWLRDWLVANNITVPPEGNLSALPEQLASDPRRVVGEKLWSLGLLEEAKGELESLRQAYADDPLASYQLAVYFRDLGLYRSSIIAAATVLAETGTYLVDAPRFIARMVYPVYYADLIVPLAEEYGYDPRLQFALVRQESLFESFARSSAAAQGLAQVIPDTGAWIAQRLAWPDFENEDLYKPYVGLRFGAYYLSQQLAGFNEQVHAALAAYNAGPGNAARWYEIAGDDHDAFVDAIDFGETLSYVQRIYEGFNAYRFLYTD